MSLDLYFFFKINQFKILFVCKKLNAKLYLVVLSNLLRRKTSSESE